MITDVISTLFSTSGFESPAQRGGWSEPLVHAYIGANLVIALASLLFAASLLAMGRKRQSGGECAWLIPLFIAVICSSGATHACEVVAFWWPGYRLFTLISVLSAGLSAGAALAFPKVTRAFSAYPGPSEFDRITHELTDAIAHRERAIHESRGTITALKRQVDHLERMRQTGLWVAEQETALRELKTVLDSSLAKKQPP
jgi:hypothetical protein